MYKCNIHKIPFYIMMCYYLGVKITSHLRITTHILPLCCDFNGYIPNDSVISIQSRMFYIISCKGYYED